MPIWFLSGNFPFGTVIRHQNGPCPMQLVVVSAVSSAVSTVITMSTILLTVLFVVSFMVSYTSFLRFFQTAERADFTALYSDGCVCRPLISSFRNRVIRVIRDP